MTTLSPDDIVVSTPDSPIDYHEDGDWYDTWDDGDDSLGDSYHPNCDDNWD
jgi:hypothetical protein